MHLSVAQKILRHANIETTLAIYRHVDGIEEMRAAVAKLDFGPLEEQAPFKAISKVPSTDEPQGADVDRCVSSGSGSVHCPLLLDLLGGQREARLGGPERSEQRARRVVARCRPVLEAVA